METNIMQNAIETIDLTNYTVVERNKFNKMNWDIILNGSTESGTITISKACLNQLGNPPRLQLFINLKKKLLAVMGAFDEKAKDTVEPSYDVHGNGIINDCYPFLTALWERMNFNPYKCIYISACEKKEHKGAPVCLFKLGNQNRTMAID